MGSSIVNRSLPIRTWVRFPGCSVVRTSAVTRWPGERLSRVPASWSAPMKEMFEARASRS